MRSGIGAVVDGTSNIFRDTTPAQSSISMMRRLAVRFPVSRDSTDPVPRWRRAAWKMEVRTERSAEFEANKRCCCRETNRAADEPIESGLNSSIITMKCDDISTDADSVPRWKSLFPRPRRMAGVRVECGREKNPEAVAGKGRNRQEHDGNSEKMLVRDTAILAYCKCASDVRRMAQEASGERNDGRTYRRGIESRRA